MNSTSLLNFYKGHVSYDLLPNKEIVEATQELLTPAVRVQDNDPLNRHPLTYGSDEGAYIVRQAVAKFINQFITPGDILTQLSLNDRFMLTRPEHLNLTSGSSYGVMNILLQTTLPHTGYTKQVFIVTPTYFLINKCFLDAGFGGKMTAIKEVVDESDSNFKKKTLDLKTLINKLNEFEKEGFEGSLSPIQNPNSPPEKQKKIYKYVMYLVPTYSNPSGLTYDSETKIKLVEIARKYDMLIITDDVYDMLNFCDEPENGSMLSYYGDRDEKVISSRMRLVHVDRGTLKDSNSFGNTISNASFSKLIAPGLRVGYQESVNEKLALQLSRGGANTSGGTPAQLNTMIVGVLLNQKKAESIILRYRTVLKERADVLHDSLRSYIPNASFSPMEGGYFCWVKLPPKINAKVLCEKAQELKNIVIANGSEFEVVGDEVGWGNSYVRLSISFLDKELIENGIFQLGLICDQLEKL